MDAQLASFDRLIGIPFYLVLVGGAQFVALALFSAVALVRLRAWGLEGYLRRVGQWAVFALILLVCGCVANYVFMLVANERMYESSDPVLHFVPFIPFGRWVLDGSAYQPGKLLNGASLGQIQLLWAGFAAATWGTTIVIYRAYVRAMREEREDDVYLGRRVPDLS